MKQVKESNLKPYFATTNNGVSRRDFLEAVLPRYTVIPSIDTSNCAGGYKCQICISRCPIQAIVTKEDIVSIRRDDCTACGACVTVCPHNAVVYPSYSWKELDKELQGLCAETDPILIPRIIALECQGCQADYYSYEKLVYPAAILPIKLPCFAMASPSLLLRAFEHGAQGIAVISGAETCTKKKDLNNWRDRITFMQALLDCLGIGGQRIRVFELNGLTATGLELELSYFIEEIRHREKVTTNQKGIQNMDLELHSIIQNIMVSKPGVQGATVTKGEVPFGRLMLDGSLCTACSLCAAKCPTSALSMVINENDLTFEMRFRHDKCVACAQCVETCPEKCLQMERVLDLDLLNGQAEVIFQDTTVTCKLCGKPFASQSMIEKIIAQLGMLGERISEYIKMCPECRITNQSGSEKNASGTLSSKVTYNLTRF